MVNSTIIYSFLPEIFLSVCLLTHLLFNAVLLTRTFSNFRILALENLFQSFFILSLTVLLLFNTQIEGFFFNFLFTTTLGSIIVKISSIIISILIIIPVYQNFKSQRLSFYEYFTLYLIINLALLLLISATDMISVYLAIELQALSFYIIASFLRQSAFASEAGLKYFILGSVFSGCFLFGCSLFYGIFGTLNFNYLTLLLFDTSSIQCLAFIQPISLFAVILITSTFLFKLAVAPFHFWAPEVYDGAPLASTIIFSILPKMGTFYFLIKWICLISTAFPALNYFLLFCGILSIFVGSIFAVIQTRFKKLIIYSSIAQVGYILAATFQVSVNAITSIFFFLIVYLLTLILIWNIITLFSLFNQQLACFNKKEETGLFISFLQGLHLRHKAWAILLSCSFFSIAGIPPFSGFLAKVFILQTLIESGAYVSASLIVTISLLTLFYYLRLIKISFFEPIAKKTLFNSAQTILNVNTLLINTHLTAFLCFLLLFIFFQPNLILLICHLIALSF